MWDYRHKSLYKNWVRRVVNPISMLTDEAEIVRERFSKSCVGGKQGALPHASWKTEKRWANDREDNGLTCFDSISHTAWIRLKQQDKAGNRSKGVSDTGCCSRVDFEVVGNS